MIGGTSPTPRHVSSILPRSAPFAIPRQQVMHADNDCDGYVDRVDRGYGTPENKLLSQP